MQSHEQKSELKIDEELGLSQRHLVFELGGESYACPIVQVREVIKVPALKPVPYMAASFTGLLNLRGQMVGVVDLRIHFQINVPESRPGIILVVDLGESLLGAHVDDVVEVVNVPPDEMHTNFTVSTRVSVDFLKGIANIGARMVSIIDLAKLLSSQELRTFNRAQ